MNRIRIFISIVLIFLLALPGLATAMSTATTLPIPDNSWLVEWNEDTLYNGASYRIDKFEGFIINNPALTSWEAPGLTEKLNMDGWSLFNSNNFTSRLVNPTYTVATFDSLTNLVPHEFSTIFTGLPYNGFQLDNVIWANGSIVAGQKNRFDRRNGETLMAQGWQSIGNNWYAMVITDQTELRQFELYDRTPAPVPLPGTMLLFGSGLGGVIFWRRKTA